MKRTTIDFSRHEVIVTESEELLIHFLKIPNSYTNCIRFINTSGIMAVNGDFGNWIFCTRFVPSWDNRSISDEYWIEKLEIASTQKGTEWSREKTIAKINEILKEEEDLTDDEKEYLNYLIVKSEDGELDYTHCAYRENVGRFDDLECVPFEKDVKFWLKAIFDGFEEICSRMKPAID